MRPPYSPAVPVAAAMSLDRFHALADAYGGDVSRWPEADQADALRLAADSAAAHVQLVDAAALDRALDLWRAAAPSDDLRRRILAQAPRGRTNRPSTMASGRSKLLRWLSGLGAVGVLASGALAGAAVVAVSGPSHVDTTDSVTGLYDQAAAIDPAGT
jgi:hypothetical protein